MILTMVALWSNILYKLNDYPKLPKYTKDCFKDIFAELEK